MDKVRQAQEMGYDRSVGMFSPDGLLLQVEYAEKAVKLGSPVMALTTKEGVVFVADRKIKSRLLVRDSFKKIIEVDSHIAVAGSGVMSDGRRLIEQAQVNAQEHSVRFTNKIDVISLVKDVANIQQYYSQSGGLRPFGVSLLIAGVENGSNVLYQTTPSGIYIKFLARCVGNFSDKANEELEKSFKEGMSAKDGVKLALNIFKKVMHEDFDQERFDVAILGNDEKLVRMTSDEVKKL